MNIGLGHRREHIAAPATVSQQWQGVVENFPRKQILITSDDVVAFGAHFGLQPKRRKLVKRLIYKLNADYFTGPFKKISRHDDEEDEKREDKNGIRIRGGPFTRSLAFYGENSRFFEDVKRP